MVKLIALDDGHGMETAGKRTPILPNGEKSETGNYMHENEFNRAVVKYLDIELRRCGFNTLLVAPSDADTPLKTRVNTANTKKADLYISIHANANTFTWGDWGGIETYTWGSGESLRLGKLIHKQVMSDLTDFKDRGLKDGSWLYVIKNTSMPAVLLELGFMDSKHDYKYLLQDSFRRQCAVKIAKGVCEYYGAGYVKDGSANSSDLIAYKVRRKGEVVQNTYTHNAPNFETDSRVQALFKGSVYWVYGEYQEMYILGGNQYVYKKHIKLLSE